MEQHQDFHTSDIGGSSGSSGVNPEGSRNKAGIDDSEDEYCYEGNPFHEDEAEEVPSDIEMNFEETGSNPIKRTRLRVKTQAVLAPGYPQRALLKLSIEFLKIL